MGDLASGLSTFHEGLDYLSSNCTIFLSFHLASLAEIHIENGDLDSASRTLDDASQRISQSDERFWQSEILRLRAEIAARTGPKMFNQAEGLLMKALEVSRTQQAKSLELRTSSSLGRLWQQQHKRQEAYDLIAPIYDLFTEGFDTADLKDAKALLEEVS